MSWDDKLEGLVQEKARSILKASEKSSSSFFKKDWWFGKVIDLSMKNHEFRTKVFRLVDVLPSLKEDEEILDHIREYFSDEKGELPSLFQMGLGVGKLAPSLASKAIKKNIKDMARLFITAEDFKAARDIFKKVHEEGFCTTMDLLGEASLSDKEALSYQRRYLELLEEASLETWKKNTQNATNHLGDIPLTNVSVKITSLESQIKNCAWEESIRKIQGKLYPLLEKAIHKKAFINLDMEQFDHKDMTLEVFKRALMEPQFKNYPHFGVVIQAYLKEALKDLESLRDFSRKRKTPFSIRLVKGAYWDYETIKARNLNWPNPVFNQKQETDRNFENCCHYILSQCEDIHLAVASHNVRSLAVAFSLLEHLKKDPRSLEVQMLYGMADSIKDHLIKEGFRVRQYMTLGKLIPGMAYLVRRLLENTSNNSFLRSKFADKKDMDTLLLSPHKMTKKPSREKIEGFKNHPPLDFSLEKVRKKMEKALEEEKRKPTQKIPLVIGGERIMTEETFKRENPSDTDHILYETSLGQKEHAEKAIKTCQKAFLSWREVSVEKRASHLMKLAELMEESRFELASLEILEVGKPWLEADGDVCEAIDFCRYYAKLMKDMEKGTPLDIWGETNFLFYEPKGSAVVIAPWNFPLAILTGMTAASLITGNTVIIKPAEQSSLTAYKLMEMLEKAGFPKDVISFLPGKGEVLGAHLVEHPQTQIISFTGSKQVGLEILEKSRKLQPGQRHIKSLLIEMGGKNALILDTDADLDEAVSGILHSAFGFQGQKCSACSRVLVLEGIYDRFIERFVEACKSIKIEASEDPESFLGPVVDEDSKRRILEALSKTREKILYQRKDLPKKGHFVPLSLVEVEDVDSPIFKEELFGPVLCIKKVKDLEEALEIANNTPFGLTGGIYSRSPEKIKKARKGMQVGNFYVNRSITGAMVLRQPFGGVKLSGLGSKAGGPEYLKQFMQQKVITENTLRRGASPTEESELSLDF